MTARTTVTLDEQALREAFHEAMPNLFQPDPGSATLTVEPFHGSTCYATYIVTIRTKHSADVRVFLKDFGAYTRSKGSMERRRDRELRAYRDLLPSANLGTATYHGSVWDTNGQRFWLLLEYVQGKPLYDCEFDLWVEAARWLGRMHTHFAGDVERLKASDFLIPRDSGRLWAKAGRAEQAVRSAYPHLESRLAVVLEHFEHDTETMAGDSTTLVHGAYRPAEILVSTAGRQPRICPVDWELAGLASPLYDFAAFADGFDASHLDRLWTAYTSEAAASALSLPAPGDLGEALRPFRLHRLINWLGTSEARALSEDTVAGLIRRAEKLTRDRSTMSRPAPVSAASNTTSEDPDGDLTSMRERVTSIVQESRAPGARVIALSITRSPDATVFPSYVARTVLDDGTEQSLFVKRCGLQERAHPNKRCRDREARVYERLLAGTDSPVPHFYGAYWDDAGQQLDIVLEHVNGVRLDHQALDYWFAAARHLGRLHAAFAKDSRSLLADDFLLRLDARYCGKWAARAVDATAECSTGLAQRLSRVVDGYDRVTALLDAQPRTLVHNDMAPQNVVIDTTTTPARLCIVDWEMAGVGCGLLDLARLTYGFDPDTEERLSAAYVEEWGSNMGARGMGDLGRARVAAALHNTLYRLARAGVRQASLEKRTHWVDEAETLYRVIS